MSWDEATREFANRGGRQDPSGMGVNNERVIEGRAFGEQFHPAVRAMIAPFMGTGAEVYEQNKRMAMEHPTWKAVNNAVASKIAPDYVIDETTSPYDAEHAKAYQRGVAGGGLYPDPRGPQRGPAPVPGMTPHVTTSETFHVPEFAMPKLPKTTAAPSAGVPAAPPKPSTGDPFTDGFNEFLSGAGSNMSGSAFPDPAATPMPGDDTFGTVDPSANNYGEPDSFVPGDPADQYHPDVNPLAGSDLTPDEQRIAASNNFDVRDLFGGYYGSGGAVGGGNGNWWDAY